MFCETELSQNCRKHLRFFSTVCDFLRIFVSPLVVRYFGFLSVHFLNAFLETKGHTSSDFALRLFDQICFRKRQDWVGFLKYFQQRKIFFNQNDPPYNCSDVTVYKKTAVPQRLFFGYKISTWQKLGKN